MSTSAARPKGEGLPSWQPLLFLSPSSLVPLLSLCRGRLGGPKPGGRADQGPPQRPAGDAASAPPKGARGGGGPGRTGRKAGRAAAARATDANGARRPPKTGPQTQDGRLGGCRPSTGGRARQPTGNRAAARLPQKGAGGGGRGQPQGPALPRKRPGIPGRLSRRREPTFFMSPSAAQGTRDGARRGPPQGGLCRAPQGAPPQRAGPPPDGPQSYVPSSVRGSPMAWEVSHASGERECAALVLDTRTLFRQKDGENVGKTQ